MTTPTVYVDGAGSGRTCAYGGWAVVVVHEDEVVYAANGALLKATNQQAELQAAIRGLQWILANGATCDIVSDSAYVVNGLNERWYERWETNGWRASKGGEVANRDEWEHLVRLWRALGGPTGRIRARHMRGHGRGDDAPADVRGNHVADRMADAAAADAQAGADDAGWPV